MTIKDLSETDKSNFFKWLDQLNAHGRKIGLIAERDKNYAKCNLNDLENCSWFNYWQDEETPEGAIALDLSYA